MRVAAAFYAVYDADGSWLGELRYLKDKCLGKAECALCDLSHGWNPLGKSAFKQREGAAARLVWVHRDELPERVMMQVKDHLPCVALDDGSTVEVVISRETLKGCRGDFRVFEHLLEQRLGTALAT